jgi:hypothetical protein
MLLFVSMFLRVVFWLIVAIDLAAIGLFFVLGLAAAGPSHTSPVSVAIFMLPIPLLLLMGAVLLYLKAQRVWVRGLAFLMVAAPLLFVASAGPLAQWQLSRYRTPDGAFAMFRTGAMREIEEAIARDDAAAVKAAARNTNVNQSARDGSSVLLIAVRRLQQNPGPPDVLRALLEAGANPNQGGELPLAAAIYASSKSGPEPVKLLLDAGADPNARDPFGNAAYFAATAKSVDPALMQLLLDRGADLRVKSNSGGTVLSQALATQNWNVMLLLLRRGADWRSVRTPMGLDFPSALESNARTFGDQQGLAEVLQFVKNEPVR